MSDNERSLRTQSCLLHSVAVAVHFLNQRRLYASTSHKSAFLTGDAKMVRKLRFLKVYN